MSAIGFKDITEKSIVDVITSVTPEEESEISFREFLKIMQGMSESKDPEIKKTISKEGKEIHQHEGKVGFHSIAAEELETFVKIINEELNGDPDLDMIPLDPESQDLFPAVESGVLLCKFINKCVPGTIDERVINKKTNLNVFQTHENLKLAISASKGIGCSLINLDSQTIIDKVPHMIIGLVWQLVKILITKEVNLKNHPEIIHLQEADEELADLLKLTPENILLRWVNFHLKNAGTDRRVKNFSTNIQDSICYTYLLNQLDKNECDLVNLEEEDTTKRAEKVLKDAEKLIEKTFITSSGIVKGNSKLNLVFVSELFNNKHGLPPLTKDEEYEAAQLLDDDDVESTKEERVFRLWMNSLGVEDLYINNLYEDVKDGINLIKVIEKIDPKIIDWKKVEKKPTNRFKKLHNNDYALKLCKEIGIKLIGIGGMDIVDEKRKMVLGVTWQLMRKHYLTILGDRTEADILKWANGMVGKEQISGFKDKSLSDSKYLINLCAAIEPRAVNWDLVTPGNYLHYIYIYIYKLGETQEDKEMNAKYCISISRKLGAIVFLIFDDIVDV